MRHREAIRVKGELEVTVYEAGRQVSRQRISNLVTTSGLSLIAAILAGTGDPISHLALGTSDTAADAADEALETEVYRDSITSLSASGNQLRVSHFVPSTAAIGDTLAEAGLFNGVVGGADTVMFARALLDQEVTKTDQITVTVTWTIDFEVP